MFDRRSFLTESGALIGGGVVATQVYAQTSGPVPQPFRMLCEPVLTNPAYDAKAGLKDERGARLNHSTTQQSKWRLCSRCRR